MANGSSVYRAISSIYRRALRELREAFEDGWPPRGSNGGGGGYGRPVPVRVPVPVSRNPYNVPRPSSSSSSAQTWYANASRRFASTIAQSKASETRFARHAGSKPVQPRLTSLSVKLSNVAFAPVISRSPIWTPRSTSGTLQRPFSSYYLKGFGARGAVRHFSYQARPLSDVVITNLSVVTRAGGLQTSKLMSKTNHSQHFSTTMPQAASPSDVDSLSDTWSASRFGFSSCQVPLTSPRTTDLYDQAAIKKAQETTYLDFDFSPTFTFAESKYTELSNDVIDLIAEDIDRFKDDMKKNLADIRTIANRIGSLRVSVSNSSGTKVSVHFPDRTPFEVDRICQDLSIKRGVIRFEENDDLIYNSPIGLELDTAGSSVDTASLYNDMILAHTGWTSDEFSGGLNSEVIASEYSFPDAQSV